MVGVGDIRDINQTVFLHLIREKQPISRADLAKHTGLRAGTVSTIVNRLIKGGLVYEGTEGPSSGGRPPKYLYINSESFYVLAIDIGVTDSVYAVSDFSGRILQQRSILTEGEPEQFLAGLADAIINLVSSHFPRARFAAVGVSLPGLIDRETGSIVSSPNLEWTDVPVRKILQEKLDNPCGSTGTPARR
jgi:hypothetical protein